MKSIAQIRRGIEAQFGRLSRPDGEPVQIMEVCGTHTVAASRGGLRELLPEGLRLISGPGCPVCVTDQSYIDRAVQLVRSHGDVIVASYGDMIRVPGQDGSLAEARSQGAAVQVVYAAADAVALARRQPDRHVVFLGIGFETTTPGAAMAILQASQQQLDNFSVLSDHKLLLPAMRALLGQVDVRIHGFLCPGHVSVIIGWRAFEPIVAAHRVPCVVAGFEDEQILMGIERIVAQLADSAPAAESVYPPVAPQGNPIAREMIDRVFVPADTRWRGLGLIPASGLTVRDEYAQFDTQKRFEMPEVETREPAGCRCGDVICGRIAPTECGLFASRCTPREPVGPCMVSSEGSCAAYYRYQRRGR